MLFVRVIAKSEMVFPTIWCWSDLLVGCEVWARLVEVPSLGLPSWFSVSFCNGLFPFAWISFKNCSFHQKRRLFGVPQPPKLNASVLFCRFFKNLIMYVFLTLRITLMSMDFKLQITNYFNSSINNWTQTSLILICVFFSNSCFNDLHNYQCARWRFTISLSTL